MVVRTGSNQRDPSSLVQQFIDTIPVSGNLAWEELSSA